jgi:HEAT repeat protein
MPNIQEWVGMYSSQNREVKLRAAQGLLQRAEESPLEILVEILETLSWEGLGANAERALLKRREPEVAPKMIALLASKDHFVREVACNVLGHFGDRTATPHLLRMIDDPHMVVRRAAGFGLAFLNDPSSLTELKKKYECHRDDDSNVVMALQCALQTLGVEP